MRKKTRSSGLPGPMRSMSTHLRLAKEKADFHLSRETLCRSAELNCRRRQESGGGMGGMGTHAGRGTATSVSKRAQ